MKIWPFPSGTHPKKASSCAIQSPLDLRETYVDDFDWPAVSLDEGIQQLRELGDLESFIQDPTLPTIHLTLTPERLKKPESESKKDKKRRIALFPKKIGPFPSATSWIHAILRSGSSPRDFLQWGLQQGWREGDHLRKYIRTWRPQ